MEKGRMMPVQRTIEFSEKLIIAQEMVDRLCINDELRGMFQTGRGCTKIISPEGEIISRDKMEIILSQN